MVENLWRERILPRRQRDEFTRVWAMRFINEINRIGDRMRYAANDPADAPILDKARHRCTELIKAVQQNPRDLLRLAHELIEVIPDFDEDLFAPALILCALEGKPSSEFAALPEIARETLVLVHHVQTPVGN